MELQMGVDAALLANDDLIFDSIAKGKLMKLG